MRQTSMGKKRSPLEHTGSSANIKELEILEAYGDPRGSYPNVKRGLLMFS